MQGNLIFLYFIENPFDLENYVFDSVIKNSTNF